MFTCRYVVTLCDHVSFLRARPFSTEVCCVGLTLELNNIDLKTKNRLNKCISFIEIVSHVNPDNKIA